MWTCRRIVDKDELPKTTGEAFLPVQVRGGSAPANEDQEETFPPGRVRSGRGEFAEPSSVDTGLAAGSSSGRAFPLCPQEPPSMAITSSWPQMRRWTYCQWCELQERRAASVGWDEAETELSDEEDLRNDRPQLASSTGNVIDCKPRSEEEAFLPGQVRGGNAPGKSVGEFAGTDPADTSLAAASGSWALLLC